MDDDIILEYGDLDNGDIIDCPPFNQIAVKEGDNDVVDCGNEDEEE